MSSDDFGKPHPLAHGVDIEDHCYIDYLIRRQNANVFAPKSTVVSRLDVRCKWGDVAYGCRMGLSRGVLFGDVGVGGGIIGLPVFRFWDI